MNKDAPRSFAELSFYLIRAATGAGLAPGLGEELAANAVYLATHDIDPSPDCARLLQVAWDDQERVIPTIQTTDKTVIYATGDFSPLSAITVAPIICDQIITDAHTKIFRSYLVQQPSQPMMFIAALARCTKVVGEVQITLRTLDNQMDVSLPQELQAAARIIQPDPDGIFEMEITRPGNSGELTTVDVNLSGGIVTNSEAWRIIYGFFHRSLVPSNAESRLAGAGAGLTDND
jgi:hypothetical protein